MLASTDEPSRDKKKEVTMGEIWKELWTREVSV